jgi:hypothetical protein
MLNAKNQQNVLVICTGTGTKWINSDVYFDTGEIVEVEQPADVDESELNLACFSSFALDHKQFANTTIGLTANNIIKSSERVSTTKPQYPNGSSFLRPASRAPPFFYLA